MNRQSHKSNMPANEASIKKENQLKSARACALENGRTAAKKQKEIVSCNYRYRVTPIVTVVVERQHPWLVVEPRLRWMYGGSLDHHVYVLAKISLQRKRGLALVHATLFAACAILSCYLGAISCGRARPTYHRYHLRTQTSFSNRAGNFLAVLSQTAPAEAVDAGKPQSLGVDTSKSLLLLFDYE